MKIEIEIQLSYTVTIFKSKSKFIFLKYKNYLSQLTQRLKVVDQYFKLKITF